MAKLKEFVESVANGRLSANMTLEERVAKTQRIEIAREMLAISEKHNVPISYIAYIAVSKESHKVQNLDKSLTKFNKDKALAIIAWSKEFGAKHGYKVVNDKIYHAVCAFYERKSNDHNDFKAALDRMEVNSNFATAKEICKALGME